MNFTQDWFTYNIPHLTELVGLLPMRKRFLEVGCFEGRATCWFLEHALDDDGEIVCIDPFTGSMEHDSIDLSDLYNRFISNVAEVEKSSQCVSVMKEYSFDALAQLITRKQQFDFIYVDGDHSYLGATQDLNLALSKVKPKGIIAGHDYAHDYKTVLCAVNDFLDQHNLQLDYITLDKLPSFGIIKK